MALIIEDPEVERLVAEAARNMGVSESEALREILNRSRPDRIDGAMRWLREEVWPTIPAEVRGKPIPKAEWDALNDEGGV